MTRRVEALLRFLWDFVIGDDWRIAAGVAAALGITALVTDTHVSAWWIVPVAVAVLLGGSVWRVARQATRPGIPALGEPADQAAGSDSPE